ncbi:MAG: ankyrin repeat domain-containing protein [Candidatus Anstonellales archaeon]
MQKSRNSDENIKTFLQQLNNKLKRINKKDDFSKMDFHYLYAFTMNGKILFENRIPNFRDDRELVFFGNLLLVHALLNGYNNFLDSLTNALLVKMIGNFSTAKIYLHFALIGRNLELFNEFMRFLSFSVNELDHLKQTFLHNAALSGDVRIIEYLIKYYKQNPYAIDMFGSLPLHNAAEVGSLDVIRYFLTKHNISVDSLNYLGRNILFESIMSQNLQVFLELIKYFPKYKDARDKYGNNLLHISIMHRSSEITCHLIENEKMNVNSLVYSLGLTPLMLAARINDLETINYLIKLGARVNQQDFNGMNSLHHAVLKNNLEAVELLLNNNADVNAKTLILLTPLHIASVVGNLEIVKLLLKYGADISATDIFNRTPLELAINSVNADIARYLIEYGANARGLTNGQQIYYSVNLDQLDLVGKINSDSKEKMTDYNSREKAFRDDIKNQKIIIN